jgi:two-component system cell cycle response regulator DivK
MRARILIIEHQDTHLAAITASLSSTNHELLVATDAENGVALARRHRPHLLLCAIDAPSNGIQVLSKLRVDSSFDSMPIVAVTRFSNQEDRNSLLRRGFRAVIGKPVPPDFAELVEKFLPTSEGFQRSEQGPQRDRGPSKREG